MSIYIYTVQLSIDVRLSLVIDKSCVCFSHMKYICEGCIRERWFADFRSADDGDKAGLEIFLVIIMGRIPEKRPAQ